MAFLSLKRILFELATLPFFSLFADFSHRATDTHPWRTEGFHSSQGISGVSLTTPET